MPLEGSLALTRGDGIAFFKVEIPDDDVLEDALMDFVQERGRGPGELVESLWLDAAKRSEIGLPPGDSIWWAGFKLDYDLPRTASLRVETDETVNGIRVTDIKVSTQDRAIFEDRPLQRYGGIYNDMSYDKRRVATNAMNKMATIRKNYPAKQVTERDFAKAQSDALVEELSDDAAYQRYRQSHLNKIAKASSGTPVLQYFEDEAMEDKVEKLRRQELGPESVYEVFTLALDVAADDLADELGGTHAQRVGRLLDEDEIQKAWSYVTTAGRAQGYDELVSQVRKSSYRTQAHQALDVISDLIGE